MAIRYCGSVKIDCKITQAQHVPGGEHYKCDISVGGQKLGTQYVGIPEAYSGWVATDSAKAYDEAAHAALSFAVDEEERGKKDWGGIGDKCDNTDSGYMIRRTLNYGKLRRS